MVVRRKKTTRNKQRAERTHGHGGTKKNRGAGNHGGRGRAGSQKHKFSKYYTTFGIKVRMTGKPKGKALNVGVLHMLLEKWVAKGKAVEEDGMITVDGKKVGYSKILGGGTLSSPIYVRNMIVSEKARQKIEGANGEIEDMFEGGAGETKVTDPTPRGGDE